MYMCMYTYIITYINPSLSLSLPHPFHPLSSHLATRWGRHSHPPTMYAPMGLITALLVLAIFFSPEFPTAHATNSSNLKILVPLKLGFEEFVSWQSSEIPVTPNSVVNFSGFAINVFQECVEKLNYRINYTLIGYGDGLVDPTYNDLVQKLVSKVLH